MEKHGYTPLQQINLLRDQLIELIADLKCDLHNIDLALTKLNNPVPDYGGIAIPGMSDNVATLNRASNTATCLQTLIMLAAIKNKQLDKI